MSLSLDIFTPVQATFIVVIVAVLGAVFGSFINCLAWRVVNGESVLQGRSHCATCNHVLEPLDLLPVVSWLALRGRCRYCGQKVGVRYVLVEAVMACVFVALLVAYGAGVPFVAYAAFACVLMGASLVDLDTRTIPNGFVIAGIVIWVATVAFMQVPQGDTFGAGTLFASMLGVDAQSTSVATAAGSTAANMVDAVTGSVAATNTAVSGVYDAASATSAVSLAGLLPATFSGGVTAPVVFMGPGWLAVLVDGLAGAFVVSVVPLLLSLVMDKVLGRASFGGGDVKLLFAIGLFLGLPLALLNLLVACVFGLLFAFVQALLCDRHDHESFRTRAIPFGPALAAATVATLVFGPLVLTWYVTLL